jgi:hypothetical protein
VPGFEPLHGWRVAAAPDALDRARWQGDDVQVLRIAADEALGLGARGVEVDDPHAIVEVERGFVGAWLTWPELQRWVVPHVEWHLPHPTSPDGPQLAQGNVARVPAKLWLPGGDTALLVTHAAYVHDLSERLGWPR